MKRLIIICSLLGTCSVSPAETLTGVVLQDLTAYKAVWDLSGTYRDSGEGFEVEYIISMDAGGKLTGTGNARFTDPSDPSLDIPLTLELKGSAKSSGGIVRVSYGMKMNGLTYIQGYPITCTIKMNADLQVDPDSKQLVGLAKGSVKMSSPSLKRSVGEKLPNAPLTEALPDTADGIWAIHLDVAAAEKNKYSGGGTVAMSNRAVPLELKGSYKAKTDLSMLTLKGDEQNRSVSLSVSTACTNSQLTIRALSGKILGQKVSYAAPR